MDEKLNWNRRKGLFVPKTMLAEKFGEALRAVAPIVLIVLVLSFSVAPVPSGILLAFLVGGAMLIIGMMLFTLGAELSMEPMGHLLGARITKTKRLWVVLLLGFVLGVMITVSEPDLQVLAGQVQSIPPAALICSVAVGVGLFLLLALVRMLFCVSFRTMLLVSYVIVLILTVLIPESFLAVAFDSGGVTTGPVTVPFIMAFGIGVSSIRNDERAAEDSFGLVSLCSVGPILAVLILGIIFRTDGVKYSAALVPDISDSVALGGMFLSDFPEYFREIAVSLLPMVVFFLLFQLLFMKLDRHTLGRIMIGVGYTYFGLVLFLTGVNVGFMPAGSYLGHTLALLQYRWILVPLGMLIGYFIVRAEPAVYVLMKQVEELTNGAVSGGALRLSLSFGVAVSVGLAMVRVLTGLSILWFIIPGYGIALALSFFVPKMFTAIAFDSGGVASGPMTATFLLPFAVGACVALGGNVVTDAFGVVAMVAMTPLITIQILGVIYRLRSARPQNGAVSEDPFAAYDDYAIIEL